MYSVTAILSILAKPDQKSCSSPAGITEVGGMRGGDGPEAGDL
jgi:hypothetical protein